MSAANPILPAILADPDDDTPRLVCADWLEEHGDAERGQFIRAQCELAELPSWDRRRQELLWLTEDLQARHGARWRAELPVLEGVQWVDFERGFAATVRVENLVALYRHGAAIAAAAPVYRAELSPGSEANTPRLKGSVPWLRALRFSGYFRNPPRRALLQGVTELDFIRYRQGNDLCWLNHVADPAALTTLKVEGDHTVGLPFARALTDAPWAGRLTRLELGTRFVDHNSGYFEDPTLGSDGAGVLARSPRLAGLRVLNLSRQRINLGGLQALLSSSYLQRLEELHLRSNGIDDVSRFIGRPEGAPLSRLDLSDNPLGDGGVRVMAQWPRSAKLACLGLDTCEISEDGIHALTGAPCWATLCRLDLSRNPLGSEGVLALAGAKPPGRLHELRLTDCDLDSEAGEALAAIPWLANLQSLDLSRNALKAHGVYYLGWLAGGALRSLSLARTGMGPEAVAELAPLWPQMVVLDLSDNHLRTGLGKLMAAGAAPHLQTLRLRSADFPRGGLEGLLQPGVCPSLHTLVLAGNTRQTIGLQKLLKSELAGQLRDLDLSRCGLGDADAHLLAQTPALARLNRLNLRDNTFGEEGLVALAQSPHLRGVPRILLSGNPYGFAPASRQLLQARFGLSWYFQDEPEEGQEADEQA
jgi:uncharacterized protein (TIGR02996 family)